MLRYIQRVIHKTADYTVNPQVDHPGQVFTNRGATGTVIFTLPVVGTGFKPLLMGAFYEFEVHADYSVRVAAATGTIVTQGNAAANSVGFEIASNKVGGRIIAKHDGVQWSCFGIGPGFCVNGTQVGQSSGSVVAPVATPVAGVAAGYKIARGVHTQVAASDTVVTGLATVVAVVVSFSSSPTVKQLWCSATIGDQAGTPAAGSVLMKTWKPTANDNATPTAATDFTENLGIAWVAIGT